MTFRLLVTTLAVAAAAFPQALDMPYQARYLSNLNLGDSYVNISNSGATGAVGLASGTTAAVTGALCANVYVFSPDEQMISCCSCPVTPNGLVSLSARNDLISNTLTPAVPTSVMVKLLSSVPVGGSCANSATSVGTGANVLAVGLMAWAATVHAGAGAGAAPTMTETAFTTSTLSAAELNRLNQLCTFINANGSGFGVCRSCRLGGLGAGRR